MFARTRRLSREDFPNALSRGKRLTSANLTLVVPREARGHAVVVSKKVEKLSVRRHTLKRRIIAAMESLALPPSLIVLPKKTALTLSTKELRDEIESLLLKRQD